MSKFIWSQRVLGGIMLVMGAHFSVASEEGTAISRLPVLAWTQRSDWINVKNPPMPTTADKLLDSLTTEVPVAAKGDGVADDTIVIQDLLDKVTNGQTLYFPPGRYRITHPLRLLNNRLPTPLVFAIRNRVRRHCPRLPWH